MSTEIFKQRYIYTVVFVVSSRQVGWSRQLSYSNVSRVSIYMSSVSWQYSHRMNCFERKSCSWRVIFVSYFNWKWYKVTYNHVLVNSTHASDYLQSAAKVLRRIIVGVCLVSLQGAHVVSISHLALIDDTQHRFYKTIAEAGFGRNRRSLSAVTSGSVLKWGSELLPLCAYYMLWFSLWLYKFDRMVSETELWIYFSCKNVSTGRPTLRLRYEFTLPRTQFQSRRGSSSSGLLPGTNYPVKRDEIDVRLMIN